MQTPLAERANVNTWSRITNHQTEAAGDAATVDPRAAVGDA